MTRTKRKNAAIKAKNQPPAKGTKPMTEQQVWIIEPRDPLIVRDGRPFNTTPGAKAVSLAFPFPSTTTGGFRTHVWRQKGDTMSIEKIKEVQVRGPLLVELAEDGITVVNWMVPAPTDALFFEEKDTPNDKRGIRKRLVPLNMPDGACTDLTERDESKDVCVVGLPKPDPSKPHKSPPRFWRWNEFEKWLCNPQDDEKPVDFAGIGHNGPVQESRTHVKIDSDSQAAQESMLFQTRGLEFVHKREEKGKDDGDTTVTYTRLALAIAVEDKTEPQDGGITPLGGERRMTTWRKSTSTFDSVPLDVLDQVKRDKACRVILLTPAYFDQGWKPKSSSLLREGVQVQPKLKAAACQRPQVVSGWDFDKRQPKPTRRLVPAGSVYFLSLEGASEEAIEAWVKVMWMSCISDTEQDRWDGFGLAVIGTWDGKLQKMTITEDKEDKQCQ